jgi:TatD DNase family protein
MQLIDIGANLTSTRFHKDIDDVLQRARQQGVVAQLVTGTSLRASTEAVALAARHPDIYATCGIHPHDASHFDAGTIKQLTQLASHHKIRAIGETGLDFNRNFSPRPAQERAFSEQLALAAQLGKPVFLHQRDAHERFLPLLKEQHSTLSHIVVHCFTGTREEMFDYLDMGCFIGITGWVCDRRRGELLRNIVANIPDDRLMIETDAPYLLPHNLESATGMTPVMKGRNEPAFLPAVLHQLAICRHQSIDVLAAHCLANSLAFMGLAPSDLLPLPDKV